jgi:hypothetical protein
MKFVRYKSSSGKSSGVTGYVAGEDFIIVKFQGSEIYKHTYASAGKEVVEKMKGLAKQQQGLSTFISQKRPDYEV